MRSNVLKVRDTVAALRAALLLPPGEGAPETLDTQMPSLHLAALSLEQLPRDTPDPETRRELTNLSRDLRACLRLIAQGLDVSQGMLRLLTPPSASYQSDGEPVPPPSGGTLLIRG